MCVNECSPFSHTLAESGSHDDMSRLIQLVLGIAINCEHKDSELSAFMDTYSHACIIESIQIAWKCMCACMGMFAFSIVHYISRVCPLTGFDQLFTPSYYVIVHVHVCRCKHPSLWCFVLCLVHQKIPLGLNTPNQLTTFVSVSQITQ